MSVSLCIRDDCENYYACPGLQERADATTLSIPESQQHIEPSISHRSKRLKFVESSTGKLKLMDSPHGMCDLRPTEQRPLLPSTFTGK